MKTIGIIGGFSPEATALLYVKLTRLARRGKANRLPHIIVWNVPMPFGLESRLLTRGEGLTEIRPLLVEAAQGLERAGADVVVLPCNTLHTLAPHVRRNILVPFIDIIDASVAELQRLGVARAGLLGTAVTLRSNLFSGRKVRFITPGLRDQQKLTEAIHGAVSGHKLNQLGNILQNNLVALRKRGVTDVLLACTDFSDNCPRVAGMRTHDSLTILANTVNKYKFYTGFRRRVLS